ncbi:hypothetical protein TELCIR_25765, partial [Teladorsagia circumcincta]
SRPPYGGPPGHLRGPPGPLQSSRSMEDNTDAPAYAQERYNGPVALQQDDRRPLPGGPRALFPPTNRQDGPPVNGGSWREDSGQSYGASSWQSNMQKPGPNSGPPIRKPLISKPPSTYNDDVSLLKFGRKMLHSFNRIKKPAMPPVGRQGGRPPLPPPQPMRQPQPPITRTPLLGPNFGSGPNAARPTPT